MFNKLKQFKDMRDQAKTMQDALAGESVTVKSSGVELTMNGNLEVTDVVVEDELLSVDKKVKLQSAIIDAHKDALKKMQRIMAMKMKEMGGMPNIPGMN
ncbi:nucleoid-associated protein, YbaB/EbfC family [Candidatus Parcubacteria bacterium]|mgnify:CR=1 FL=1|nr:MAG: nucleoid-associated protein, YbaB/EbfC family [Candidatus Parcubacteria bacterium]